jgi:hypothetical protein
VIAYSTPPPLPLGNFHTPLYETLRDFQPLNVEVAEVEVNMVIVVEKCIVLTSS